MTEAAQTRSTPWLIRLFWALVDVYHLGLLLYLVLHTLTGTRFWPVALVANFIHWLLLPAFLTLALGLWQRRRMTLLFSAVNIAAFVWLFGALFLPQEAPAAASDARALTVMTYNINTGNATPDRLIPVLRESGADIIGLVEIRADQQAAIEQTLADEYPYRVFYGSGIPGMGLISRFPILSDAYFYLETERLPHLRAELAVDGEPLTVIVAHPPPPGLSQRGYHYRAGASDEIATLAQMALDSAPTLLIGDFNIADQSDQYNLLADAGLTDTFRAAGWGLGLTWPSRPLRNILPVLPLVRIDYIWTTPEFAPLAAWVGPHAGSDHLPVIAELAWHSGS
jgi:vancomycin resistance protein VanJ